MNRRARMSLLAVTLWICSANLLPAQVMTQATSFPTVTAENEPWYLNGEPITYAGSLYYPSGAQIYFNPTEMVRSGFHMGIPLFTRRTIEPYSIVYVPLAGGRMQPYERPRTGELTGTAGSTPSTLPRPAATVPPAGLAPQAAGPPSQTVQASPVQTARPIVAEPPGAATTLGRETPRAAGTAGRARQTHTRIGGRPEGTNSIFIQYLGRRWYPSGGPQRIDLARLSRVGQYRGFDVWASPADTDTIYIPVTRGSTAVVAYSRTRSKRQ